MADLARYVSAFGDEWSEFGGLLEMLARGRTQWQKDALCAEHPEVNFFPERGQDGRAAKAVCSGCLVRSECAGWALDQGPALEGIWGGTSKADRAAVRRPTAA